MAKYALSLSIKIALFAAVMLIVAKSVPYDGLVDYITGLFDFQSANNFTRFVLGEPDPEMWKSLSEYFSIFINISISVPVMSVIITARNFVTHTTNLTDILREWGGSTLRRLVKIFVFTFLFWALFRLLPYQSIFPDRNYSRFIIAAIVGFNLFLTIVCYWFIIRKIIIKRRLRNANSSLYVAKR